MEIDERTRQILKTALRVLFSSEEWNARKHLTEADEQVLADLYESL